MSMYTFGYQGLGLDAFLSRLRAAGVRRLIDVRETPFSRKPGFSKGALCAARAAVRAGAPAVVHLTAGGEVPDSPGARLASQGDPALGGSLPG